MALEVEFSADEAERADRALAVMEQILAATRPDDGTHPRCPRIQESWTAIRSAQHALSGLRLRLADAGTDGFGRHIFSAVEYRELTDALALYRSQVEAGVATDDVGVLESARFQLYNAEGLHREDGLQLEGA